MKPPATIFDRLIVTPLEQNRQTPSGLALPDNVRSNVQRGRVVAVGNGRPLYSGGYEALVVSVGDVVQFVKTAGTEIEYGGEKFLAVREGEVLAVEPSDAPRKTTLRE